MGSDSFITWSVDLETGHPEIDAQHKTLVETLARLHLAIQSGQGDEELDRCLSFLKAYTRVHFRAEEALLRQAGVEFESHRAAHAGFLKRIDRLFARHIRGELGLVPETLEALQGWLLDHIQSEDRILCDLR